MQAVLTRIMPVQAPASQPSTAAALPAGERVAALVVLVVLVVTILA